MDTTQTVTHISLCAGYGGIDLGLRGAISNLRTVAFSEIEGFACANLVSKMEAGLLDCAPIWTDLKTFPWRAFRDRVDILSGGYPCQPFSAAGKRLGTDDPRHLWPFIADGIRILRPSVCFFENVEGHISLGLREVIGELESMGYKVSWGIFSAREVGAPHQRKRVFILAMANNCGKGLERLRECRGSKGWQASDGYAGGSCSVWPSRPGQPQHGWEPPRVVGNADCFDRRTSASGRIDDTEAGSAGEIMGDTEGVRSGESTDGVAHAAPWADASSDEDMGDTEEQGCGRLDDESIKKRMEARRHFDGSSDPEREKHRQAQPPLGGDADGTTRGMDYAQLCVSCDNRTDELRLLGNGVVPATATLAFQTLLAELLNL